MPFGLANAPATYQRLMEQCLDELHMVDCFIYLDDFIIFSKSFEEHLERLDRVLNRIRECGIKLSPKKCEKKCTKKKSSTGVWKWGAEQQEAFDYLKSALSSPPILAYPDYTKPFELHTDASHKGLGAVLSQTQDEKSRVIAYASRGLTKSEKNYPAHKLEFLALKWAVTEKFKDYLYNNEFQVLTDNNPLTYVLTSAKLDATGHLCSQPVIESVCRAANSLNDFDPSDSLDINDLQYQDIRTAQRRYIVIGPCIENVLHGYRPPRDEIPKESWNPHLYRQYDSLKVVRGILYREVPDDGRRRHLFVIPEVLVPFVLRSLHSNMGHLGVAKTLTLCRDRFYWPGMNTDVERWIAGCPRCLRRKVATNERAPLVSMISTARVGVYGLSDTRTMEG
ncbi:uncharacterized protein LOC117315873 [Pecten maximus]|uniref:uncharacterized protein LOC117315873 n=1 Tax=Pecten maximus TaxID=6579 RepID=UPI001458A8D6|nr:uncharacterized protein LOC117315873 [Pecten maximus]